MSTETKETKTESKKRKEPASDQEIQENKKKARFFIDVLQYSVPAGADYGANRIGQEFGLKKAYQLAREAVSGQVVVLKKGQPPFEDEWKASVTTEEFTDAQNRDAAYRVAKLIKDAPALESSLEEDRIYDKIQVYKRDGDDDDIPEDVTSDDDLPDWIHRSR